MTIDQTRRSPLVWCYVFILWTGASCVLLGAAASPSASASSDWPRVGNLPDNSHFSSLDQIRKDNVSNLKVAWVYHTGGNSDQLKTSLQCNPIVVHGVMYVTSPVLEVIALDAATGRELWKYDPFPHDHPFYSQFLYSRWLGIVIVIPVLAVLAFFGTRFARKRQLVPATGLYVPALIILISSPLVLPRILPDPMNEERRGGANRGVTYWEAGGESRILFAGGHRIVALDPITGRPIDSFGKAGIVDLRQGLGRNVDHLLYSVTSPGVIFNDLIILSARVGEGPKEAAPGDVRAFDVRTGQQKWIFHTIPHPGEMGYETWPADAWQTAGGANAWAGVTVDQERGMVYVPVSAASFDFYGGNRLGQNLFANSLVALDATSGKMRWYYQMVHHDLWDYDLPAPPNLVTIQHDGKPIDTVVQLLKNGFVFVLNRDSGKPIFPVEEVRVPASTLTGETAWETQPVPAKPAPLDRIEVTEQDLTDLTPDAHAFALNTFRQVRSAHIFTPPSKEGTIVTPGFHGGATWSGASVDPVRGRLIVNTNDVPFVLQLANSRWWQPYRYRHLGFNLFTDQNGYPGTKPPWGKLTEIDLNTGDVVWQVPLGEYPELTARGVPVTGAENAGGSIVTAGGLIFIGATKDRKFRALDVDTGQTLWSTQLDAAAHAMPSTYSVNGTQYVAVAAGGGSIVNSPTGDEYIAFALTRPEGSGH